MTSTHVVRKAVVSDSAFDHQIHDFMDDDHSSDDSDDEAPETKNQNFEFSDGYGIMRMIRLVIVVQIISIAMEDPTQQMSILFRICVRGPLFYSIRFYSRPFLDLLYLIQYFYQEIVDAITAYSSEDHSGTSIEISRRLNTNPYLPTNSTGGAAGTHLPDGVSTNTLNERQWHVIKYFSHYLLGILFLFMSVMFLIKFWQISDYSNRSEIKAWLHKYISDGWWRRGGLNVATSMARGLLVMGVVLLMMNCLATAASAETFPESRILGALFAVSASVIAIIWFLGYIGIRFTEASFVRYVSQNVSYTSAIILKRAVKAKLDLGIMLMCLVYMPVLFTLVQSVTIMTDWNDTLAPKFRKGVNYFVPCFFQAFPPYQIQHLPTESCPVAGYTSPDQPLLEVRPDGFYDNSNILNCDSYLGVIFFTVGATLVVYAIVGYWYVFNSMVTLVSAEFKDSKFVDILEKLIRIREDEEMSYNARFTYAQRLKMVAVFEVQAQYKHFLGAIRWLALTFVRTVKGLIRAIYKPFKWIIIPLRFLLERLIVVSCLNFEAKKSHNERLSSQQSQRFSAVSSRSKRFSFSPTAGNNRGRSSKSSKKVSLLMPRNGNGDADEFEDIGFSTKQPSAPPAEGADGEQKEPMSYTEKIQAGGGLSKQNKALSFRSTKIALDENYMDELDGEQAEFSFSTKIMEYTAKYNVVNSLGERLTAWYSASRKRILKSRTVVWAKLQYSLAAHRFHQFLYPPQQNDDDHQHKNVAKLGTASLGGASAGWRLERTIHSKFRLLTRLQVHIVAELRNSKVNYISDHDLLLSVLDTTVDSAGMCTLIIPYNYTRLHWFMVVFLEITCYAVLGASLTLYGDFIIRNVVFIVVNCVFGIVTYLANPYTETTDKWLDFVGRLLIFAVLLGTILCAQMRPHATDGVPVSLYEPWESSYYVTGGAWASFGQYEFVDLFMVLFFYCYVFYVVYAVGALGVVERMVQSFQFGYHDHILDYLVENMDQRTFGMENIFTGLQLIQQWDDVIKLQRRYALLTWPDVRPANIVSTFAKIFEIKWASLFNLTLNNLRSSLGLSVLHTVMFAADGDVARWIIHANPDLLLVEDSQNDTPITIALKECAYFLLAYGEQNSGYLDDGTTYTDEQYAVYYPEVDDVRDEVYNHGEFVTDLCIPHILTSADMIMLKDEGVYREPRAEIANKDSPVKKKAKLDIHGNQKFSDEELQEMKAEKKRKAHAKMLVDKALREKTSVFTKRFPEDELIDDFEVGKMASWSVIGMNVPENNLFLDAGIVKKMLKDPNYSYELPDYDVVRGKIVLPAATMLHPADSAENDVENQRIPSRPTTPNGGRALDKDMQPIVRTGRKVHRVDKAMEVPMSHDDIKGIIDWDKKPRRRRGSSMRRDSNASASQLNTANNRSESGAGNSRKSVSMYSINSDLLSTGSGELISRLTRLNSAKTDRETRWRICKFAEILMSEEMSKSCSKFRWKLAEFKAFNKLASATQGKVAQNLAMTCSLNAPPGFVRVSEWSATSTMTMFDEVGDEDIPMVVKAIVAVIGAAESVARSATHFVRDNLVLPEMNELRGRARRRRRTSRSLSHRDNNKAGDGEEAVEHVGDRLLSDRIIQYLAESYVCSNSRLNLDDSELSYNGRVGWRAIARALRQKHCSFILPSLFVPPKLIRLKHLILTRNELDCGDAVLLSDIFTHQLDLVYVDLSFNRIGGRGMGRIAQAMRDHPTIHTFLADHNIIGPSVGKYLGVWLKKTRSLRVLSMNHNRMGEIVRFPTLYSREKILSAVHDIFNGVKSNKSLEILDLSYNHLGPDSGDVVPPAVNRHPRLHTLNFAGNDLGPEKGTKFVFYLSGFPNGANFAVKKEAFVANIKRKQAEDERRKKNPQLAEQEVAAAAQAEEFGAEDSVLQGSDDSSFGTHPLSPSKGGGLHSPSQPNMFNSPGFGKSKKGNNSQSRSRDATLELSTVMDAAENACVHPCSLTSLSVADNQLSPFTGHAIASLIERDKSLTHLDISGNALQHSGGLLVVDQLELMFGIKPREFLKIVLWEIEESKFTGRNAKKRTKVFTTLTSLNMSRNGIGPSVVASLFHTLSHPNCTLTHLDVSDNPLGLSVQQGGNARDAGVDIRAGMTESRSLRYLNLSRSMMLPVEMVSVLGGMVHNQNLLKLQLQDTKLDEPSCLQLCTALGSCETLVHIDLQRCYMGANGSALVANKISSLAERLKYIDMNDNYMGPVAAVYISEALANPKCKIKTLRIARNDLMDEGGCFIAKSLIGNISVTDLDLSGNFLTHNAAIYVADAARGLFENGKKVSDSKFKRVLINDNPAIGSRASKALVKALANDMVEHLELRDIGAMPGTAKMIAASVRDPAVAWKILDVCQNSLSRMGLNQIFWAMRMNKRLRILRCGENKAGTKFCSSEDNLLRHGISVPKCLRANVVMRELDLSYNTMSADAGINIMDAMIDNHTIKKLSLRGNLLDDSLAPMLGDLLRCNNVLEDLDIGQNQLGFSSAFALSEALEVNRSLKRLLLDYNHFGGAGTATLDAFSRSIMMNYSLQVLVFDGNKLGSSWGVRLAETFARNNTLLQVSLRDNRLDSKAGRALLKAYRHCPHLLELALSADEIGNELYEQFKLLFEVKRASTAPGDYLGETKLSSSQSKIIQSYTLFH